MESERGIEAVLKPSSDLGRAYPPTPFDEPLVEAERERDAAIAATEIAKEQWFLAMDAHRAARRAGRDAQLPRLADAVQLAERAYLDAHKTESQARARATTLAVARDRRRAITQYWEETEA